MHFLIRCIQFTVADIIRHRTGKEVGILQYDTKWMTQIIFFDLIDIDTIVADLAVCNIVETVDQIGDRRLTCSGRSDECNLLSRFGI